MADIEITVAQVTPPPEGRQKGSVKDVSGKYWLVWPKDLNNFVVGQSYRITQYDAFRAQSGKVYNTIKAYQQIVRTQSNGYATSQRATSNGSPDTERRMDIFICGAINNMLSNPNINPADLQMMDIVDQLQKLKQAWMAVFGPSPLPMRQGQQPRPDPISTSPKRVNDDLNDDIPF